jgi:hypothetical protein
MDNEKYETILLNLKIIGMIPRNGRVKRSSNGTITLEGDNILVPLKRYFLADGRRNTISDMNSILNETGSQIKLLLGNTNVVDVCYKLTEENRHIMLQITNIYKELEKSIDGIENLKVTYRDDVKTSALLDLILSKIKVQLDDIRRKIQIT